MANKDPSSFILHPFAVAELDSANLGITFEYNLQKVLLGREAGEFVLNWQLVAIGIHLSWEVAHLRPNFCESYSVAGDIELKILLLVFHKGP